MDLSPIRFAYDHVRFSYHLNGGLFVCPIVLFILRNTFDWLIIYLPLVGREGVDFFSQTTQLIYG